MSTIKTTTLSTLDGTATVPVNTVVNGSAKAWVNFNGTGTVAIRASFNVTSITDNGAGDYTVNFTTAMPDTNYNAVATCDLTSAFSAIVIATTCGATKTTSACRAQYWTASGGADVVQASFSVFR
jgi:hypothetical protein